MKNLNIHPAKPFVKWVGGKTQLLDDIRRSLPCDLSQRNEVTYVEPFVGGGAVLFWILQEYPNITRAIINDINSDLLTCYKTVRDNVEQFLPCRKYRGNITSLQNLEAKRGMFMAVHQRCN